MDIDTFRGVFSTQETDRAGQVPGINRGRKRYWLVWRNEDTTVTVQPLSASLEPTGAKRIFPGEEFSQRFTPEPGLVPASIASRGPGGDSTVSATPRSTGEGRGAEHEEDDVMLLRPEYRLPAGHGTDDAERSRLTPGEAFSLHQESVSAKAAREADRNVELAAEEKERSMRADFGMGLVFLRQGNPRKAMRIFEVLPTESGLVERHKHMFTDFGISLRKSRLLDMALRHHLKAAELGGVDENAYHNVARIYYELGDMLNATRYLRKSLELNPSLDVSERFLRYIRRRQRRSHDRPVI